MALKNRQPSNGTKFTERLESRTLLSASHGVPIPNVIGSYTGSGTDTAGQTETFTLNIQTESKSGALGATVEIGSIDVYNLKGNVTKKDTISFHGLGTLKHRPLTASGKVSGTTISGKFSAVGSKKTTHGTFSVTEITG